MHPQKRNSICKKCREEFVRDGETQVYCFKCLEGARAKPRIPSKKKEITDDVTCFFSMERAYGNEYFQRR